ncbi:MAG: mechanosensitive ion channel family protein [Bacteroidetes bacterium]|nr:mechanosensitive ion channel family protein [Bacteroidota bacterium]
MNNFWQHHFLNNPISDWAIAVTIIAVSSILLRFIQHKVTGKLKAAALKTATTIDDFVVEVIQSSVMPLLYILSIYAGLGYLDFPEKAEAIKHIAFLLVNTFFVLKMINAFIAYLFRQFLSKHEKDETREKQSRGILLIIKVMVWVLGLLFLLNNLGYNITTLIAGLGIGGIAIALAAQTILGDMFSYLVIFFDKPFEVGDFIIVDDKMGTVEYIGIKTTRIRALSGEQLVFSNADLTNSRIHNYKRMQERRVVFSFGVTYNTPAAKLAAIPAAIKKIVESLEGTKFDRAHFKEFGDFSLNFEVVYFLFSADYNAYMDSQQLINTKLLTYFEQEGIEFAFPTQTLFINKAVSNDQ